MHDEAYTLRSLTLFVSSHFMFNVLGHLQAEVLGEEKLKAISTLSDYSKILRQVCSLSTKNKISIAEEGLFLDLYLKLEQKRFSEHSIQYTLNGFEEADVYIEPLLIQPFVELAVLGILGSKDTVLKIEYNKADNSIHLQSPLYNKSAEEKLAEKCEIAHKRMKFYNHTYTQTITKSIRSQIILLKS